MENKTNLQKLKNLYKALVPYLVVVSSVILAILTFVSTNSQAVQYLHNNYNYTIRDAQLAQSQQGLVIVNFICSLLTSSFGLQLKKLLKENQALSQQIETLTIAPVFVGTEPINTPSEAPTIYPEHNPI